MGVGLGGVCCTSYECRDKAINSTVSLTYFIGVNYNCMDCSSKFWPNNLGTGDSFCVKLRASQM